MSDVVAYILIVGLIVIPSYFGIRLGMKTISAMFENQSMIVSLPFG